MENSIFSKNYWECACGELKKLRMLTFAALCCALCIVVGALYLVVGDNLRVYFTFFIEAVGCAVFGPVVGILVAAVTDTLNFLLFPSGPYFPGYMLGSMIAAVIYSLFLYRKKITVLRLYGARLAVNYLVNVLLGCLWSKILYGQGYLYYLVKSLVKNTLLLPFEVICLCVLFSVLIPAFSRFGLLPEHEKKQLQSLRLSSSAFTVLGISCILGAGCSYYYGVKIASGQVVFYILSGCLLVLGVALLIGGAVYNRKKGKKEV